MITIKNVRNLFGDFETVNLHSTSEEIIDAKGNWVLLPALIDIGGFKVIDWQKEAQKTISGGSTLVFDLFSPSGVLSKETIDARKQKINEQLAQGKIPLRNKLYLDVTPSCIEELGKIKKDISAIHIANTLIKNEAFMGNVFRLAGQEDCLVAFTADKNLLNDTKNVIEYAQIYSTQLLIFNISTKEEVQLLKEAHEKELLVDATVSPSVLVDNPSLWESLKEGTISCIASNDSKDRAMMLSVMLDGYHNNRIALEEMVEFTRIKPERLFQLPVNGDAVVADLTLTTEIGKGKFLQGGAKYTILNGATYPNEA